jgi:hypothetical protein
MKHHRGKSKWIESTKQCGPRTLGRQPLSVLGDPIRELTTAWASEYKKSGRGSFSAPAPQQLMQ